ncbi:hypothetical protein ACTFIW_006058 [Dictyostelium discoideum]
MINKSSSRMDQFASHLDHQTTNYSTNRNNALHPDWSQWKQCLAFQTPLYCSIGKATIFSPSKFFLGSFNSLSDFRFVNRNISPREHYHLSREHHRDIQIDTDGGGKGYQHYDALHSRSI